ncbi:hypothetical protein MYAM1_002604 [Malassezia yamatoensis]|uniref:Uncharacterized protein n=1 Tax=Malassezia yamatoensis TaxID=253288 RepID=A0AAJ5YSF9_9BASI|nr:hypothetical protein MYAM1_002604 [Malassezia yamatoensis]
MTDVSTLWTFAAQPLTRERPKRSQSSNANSGDLLSGNGDSSEDNVDEFAEDFHREGRGDSGMGPRLTALQSELAEDYRWLRTTNVVARAGSTQQSAELRTQQRIAQEARRAARSQHLPWRGDVAERARILRVLKGVQPLGSVADADQLSDWEEALETAKVHRARFGEKDIVQLGRRRTLAEEEQDYQEEETHRQALRDDSNLSLPSDMYGSMIPDDSGILDESGSAAFEISRNRPRRSLPQRWTPQRMPRAAAAAEALDTLARQTMQMTSPIAEDVDLDADIEDMDSD